MYKILHFIFGWDYVQWTNTVDEGVSRVHKFPDGRVGYWRYFGFKILDEITDPKKVFWLTCKPEKYINKED